MTANGRYMAARHQDRAATSSGYRLIVWQHAEPQTLHYGEPVDALAAAVEYLRRGYQCRLADETIAALKTGSPSPADGWCPVPPNTVMAAAAALRLAAQRYRRERTPRGDAEADVCDELDARMLRALERWRPA